MDGSNARPRLAVVAALVAAVATAGCATPGSRTTIPAPVAIALAGGDVSGVPAEAWSQNVEIDLKWYDRQWGMQVQKGDGYFADLTSAADGSNALEARKSDNGASVQRLDVLGGVLSEALAAYLARPRPEAVPAAAEGATPGPDVAAALAAISARLDAMEGAAAEPKPEPETGPAPDDLGPSPGDAVDPAAGGGGG